MNTRYIASFGPAYWLLAGALLLAGPVSYAQSSYNRWDARPVADPVPGKATRRAAAPTEAAPASAGEVAPETAASDAGAEAAAVANKPAKMPDKRSIILRRGLGQRLKGTTYSAADAGYYEYAWENLHYPESALRAGLSGQVMVRIDVNPAGDVTNSVVTKTMVQQDGKAAKGASTATGQEEMRRNAQELLWGLHFEPASRASQEEIPVRYVVQ